MKIGKNYIVMALLCSGTLSFSGCATYKTIDNAKPYSPKFFSGTRLNLHAINENNIALKKFDVRPPEYPWLDLPGSFALDAIVSPMSGGAVIYEKIVH